MYYLFVVLYISCITIVNIIIIMIIIISSSSSIVTTIISTGRALQGGDRRSLREHPREGPIIMIILIIN